MLPTITFWIRHCALCYKTKLVTLMCSRLWVIRNENHKNWLQYVQFHLNYFFQSRGVSYTGELGLISLPVSQKWQKARRRCTFVNVENEDSLANTCSCLHLPTHLWMRTTRMRSCSHAGAPINASVHSRTHPRTLLFSVGSGRERYLALSSGHEHVLLMLELYDVQCVHTLWISAVVASNFDSRHHGCHSRGHYHGNWVE